MKLFISAHAVTIVILVLIASILGKQIPCLPPKVSVNCSIKNTRMMDRSETIKQIVSNYKVNQKFATQVVDYAYKYQRDDFPKAHDILAIIAVESEFNPVAKSKLKKDPAQGLTQIRTQMWQDAKQCKNVKTNIEQQVRCGAFILASYYKELGNKEDAVLAYNIGLEAQKRGDTNPRYVPKYRSQLGMYIAFNG